MGIGNPLSHPSWGWTAFPAEGGMLQEQGWLPAAARPPPVPRRQWGMHQPQPPAPTWVCF